MQWRRLTLIKQSKSLGSFACGLVFLASVAPPAFVDELGGKVVAVADGDTRTILTTDNQQHKIRLVGIDAAEKKQPLGKRSRQNLARLARGK